MSSLKKRARETASIFVLAIAGGISSSAADAQPASEPAGSETVIVTGSHIATPGFETPTPVTSVSQRELQMTGVLNVTGLQYDIPALVPNQNKQAVASAPGQTTFNLRGLGATRTLFLLDGRRVMPTSYDGTTDVNILPISLIKRVDTVTGGASAAYGSDAIAGVVNVILDTEFEGLKGNLQWGQSQYHDAVENDVSVAFGAAFANGRGHFIMSGELYNNGGTDFGAARRPYLQGRWAQVPNPNYSATIPGSTKNLVLPNMGFAQMTTGGLIVSGPLKGIAFGVGGVPQTFIYGDYASATGTFMQGGSGESMSVNNSLSPVLGRQSLFSRVEFDVLPDLRAWGEVSVVHGTAESPVTPNYDSGGITVHKENPFLPTSIVNLMTAKSITTFVMGRDNVETGYNDSVGTYYDVKWDAGLNGKLGGDWTWDTTLQYSSNSFRYNLLNNRNTANWLAAIDVITNPTTGLPMCRTAATNPTCVPTNIFGPNTITPAMAAYIDGTSWNYYPQEAWDVSFNVQGTAFKNWAGDVAVAFGGEVRRDSIHGTADPITLAKGWRTANVLPFTARQQVQEGYVEADIPLLNDLPFVKHLGLNGAFRFTNYTTSGNAETWKLGLSYQVTDDLRFRGTNSRDIRAPNLNNLFQGAGSTIGLVTDKISLPYQTYNITAGTGGNPALQPEVGITNTVGVVYSPSWIPGVTASVDFNSIHLHNAISSPGTQGIMDNCYLYGQSNFCEFIKRDASGKVTFILNSEYNASLITLAGFDAEVDYATQVSDLFEWAPADGWIPASTWDGSISVRAFTTYLDNYITTNNGVGTTTNSAGTGSQPKWKAVVTATYSNDPVSVSLTYRYTGAIKINNTYITGVDINDNDVASRYYFNLSGTYNIFEHWKLYAKVDNLFNVTPPVNTGGNIAPQVSTSSSYDSIGRSYAFGLRFNF